jgi:mono/diheme cytochrome c family protein
MIRFLLPLLACFSLVASAQDGAQLYTLYCAACHAADGKGATGGTFPPLAASPYLAGDPDRAVKIVLKGLSGPVDVLGKTYNLEMPPQGAVLPDDQVAAILTYVRSSWGNQAAAVTAEQVKTIRASIQDRNTPWTAPEILKLHPLPLEKSVLSNLLSKSYVGDWDDLPDFSKEKATNVEEEHNGILSLKNAPAAEDFGMVWTGDFVAPTNGQFTFVLDADDGATLYIDNSKVLDIEGIGPMDGSRSKEGTLTLLQGSHPFRLEYFQKKANKGLALAWFSNRAKNLHWLTEDTTVTKDKQRVSIPIGPVGDRPTLYRNFITGTTPRSIGVAFPGGINLAYSADHLAPELLWTGDFLDGANKWAERGTADNPPAGQNVAHPTKSRALPVSARFTGYEIDSAGNPTFCIAIGSSTLTDSYHAAPNSLVRKLTLTGSGPAVDLLVSDKPDEATLTLSADGAPLEKSTNRTTLKLTPGKPVTLTYRWK